MGYYINVLQQGYQYELEGKRLLFDKKVGKDYYFYTCEYDEWSFDYTPTKLLVSYTNKELQYIKRIQVCSKNGALKQIGRDKVFARN
jgi:hypothetical protein